MKEPLVAHVVRRFGGVTEPFIATRIRADVRRELWTERLERPPADTPTERVVVPWLRPGTVGDRLFHRLPAIGPPLASGYARLERSRSPDVLHAHYLTTGWLVGRRTKTPLVVSTYGFDATVMARRARWRGAYGELARRAAGVVVEGPHMAQTVALLGFDPAAIHVVPIAAALAEIPFRMPQSPRDGVRLITCGRLVPKKGHALAIEGFAAAKLPPTSTLTIVGDGPLRQSLEALVARLGLRREVRFAGTLSRGDWVAALTQHDLFLAPSITAPNGDQEGGAPTTILDAQAAGVPVVGSTHADIPFLVADGITGYLSAEGSVVDLTRALQEAVSAPEQWPRIAEAARDQVMARHTDEAAAKLLRAIHAGAARR